MFDLYFAGSQHQTLNETIKKLGCNRLYSQLLEKSDIQKWLELPESPSKLLIDSGAYTAFTKGKEVNLDLYCQYINSMADKATYFVSLDVIPDGGLTSRVAAEKGYQNYLYMLKHVICPEKIMPVYHASDPIEYLTKIIETKVGDKYVDYIGLGGLVGTGSTREQMIAFFDTCFDIIFNSKNPNVKVHAFGMTSFSLLEMFPFTSADSTTWIMVGSTGKILCPRGGTISVSKTREHEKDYILNQPKPLRDSLLTFISSCGFTLEELATDYKKRMEFNILFIYEWCKTYKCKYSKLKTKKLL